MSTLPQLMSPEDGVDDDGVPGSNATLADEVEALNSIYEPGTLVVQSSATGETTASLRLPDSTISFLIAFSAQYPDVPPQILGTQSTGESARKGEGEAAVSILRDVLGRVYTEGSACLFDLVEEAAPLLSQHHEGDNDLVGAFEDEEHAKDRSASPLHLPHKALEPSQSSDGTSRAAAGADLPTPRWTLSEPLTANKSTFIACACPVKSLDETHSAIAHLLATNKKVASATHNISAWRIKTISHGTTPGTGTAAEVNNEVIIQDCDDDGETAAGGRLLHLMQLMEVWGCLVVVSRWYGGVKLGPDRFRLINQVAREAVVRGGWGKEKHNDEVGAGPKGGKGRRGKK